MSTTQTFYKAGLYVRLSDEEEKRSDYHESIENQKILLKQFCEANDIVQAKVYCDDGWSGTNFNRPDFLKMKSDIEAGRIDILLTKNLSRLGRDYLETGQLTELYFPEYHVQYIAVNDGVDTSRNDNEIIRFKNILNEFYVKENSKKVRSAYRQKAINGEFTAFLAPYGYEKSNVDKHKLVIDEEAAPIIRKIFNEAANGKNAYQIAMQLKEEKVLAPRAYTAEKYERYKTVFNPKYPYDWIHTTIVSIIKNRVYLGHMVNNKSTTRSFKCRKLFPIPKNEWIEVPNTHESLVSEEQYALAQKVIQVKHRPTKDGDRQIFSGLLKCSTCGRLLAYARQKDRKDNGNFACSLSRQKGKVYGSFHYISYDAIYQIVLTDLRKRVTAVRQNKEEFLNSLSDALEIRNRKQLAALRRE